MRVPFLAALFALTLPCAASAGAADWCPTPAAKDAPTTRALLREADKRVNDAPRPLPVVHTEGTLPNQGIREESLVARRDLPQMRAFALAWRATQETRYLEAAARYFDAWVKVYRASFNPVDETHFEAMADAYAITAPALPPSTRRATADFLRGMASGYVTRIDRGRGQKNETWTNNWQSHRVKIVTVIAVALEDEALFADARRIYVDQLNANLRADGTVEDFHLRDALHYVTYDLEPLVRAALAAKLRGEDWLRMTAKNGATLAGALDWLVPYAVGEKTHEEFVRSRVRFDAERNRAGMKGFSGLWERRESRTLFWMAALLDERYAVTAKSVSATPPDWMGACWRW